MTLVRIKNCLASAKPLCQKVRRADRHDAIFVSMPKKHAFELDLADVKAPRTDQTLDFATIGARPLTRCFDHGSRQERSQVCIVHQDLVLAAKPLRHPKHAALDHLFVGQTVRAELFQPPAQIVRESVRHPPGRTA